MRLRSRVSLYSVLGAIALLACDARAVPPSATAASAEPRGEDRFLPEGLDYRFESPVDVARHALARGDEARARQAAEAALEGASTLDAPRLRFVAGRAAAALSDTEGAVTHFRAFDAWRTHPLTPYARLEHAAAVEATDPAAALRIARELASLAFPGNDRARRIEARTRLATGDTEGAIATLRVLARESSGEALADVAVPLVAALLARADEASLREALALEHRLYAKAPRTGAGRSAAAKMTEIAESLGRLDASASEGGAPSLDERIERAEALANARSDDASEAYDDVLAAMPESDARRCTVRLARAKLLERGRDRRGAATGLLDVATTCSDAEIRGYALFKAGRLLTQADAEDDALAAFARFATEAPTSRFADDAAIAAARIHHERGEFEAARTELEAAIARYPNGDMRGEAYFLSAWSLRREGKLAEALARLEEGRSNATIESGEENAGRIAYWEARILRDLGRADEAADRFEALVRRMPLTYYGISALSRLEELDAARAESVRTAIHGDAAPLELPLDRRIDRVAFSRAAELLAVGAMREASAELRALGLLGDDDRGIWLAASLYVATNHPNDAVELVRRRMADHRAGTPEGLTRAKLRLGYPRAYEPMIEDAARAMSLSPSFVRAIAREESSFDETAVSRAQAYGLIQILVPTARGYSRDVGLDPTPTNLKDARTNLAFGTRFMARLFTRFAANPGLVPAAYNAGHGAVERWLRADRTRPFDVFVEEIPYEETRRYTRRVLQSYGIYSLLDEGRLPTFGAALPPG